MKTRSVVLAAAVAVVVGTTGACGGEDALLGTRKPVSCTDAFDELGATPQNYSNETCSARDWEHQGFLVELDIGDLDLAAWVSEILPGDTLSTRCAEEGVAECTTGNRVLASGGTAMLTVRAFPTNQELFHVRVSVTRM